MTLINMDLNMTWMLTTSDYNISNINDTTSTTYTNTTTVPCINFTTISQVTTDTTLNYSSPTTSGPKDSIATVPFTIVIIYFVIALVGVIGNILVIMAILCLPRLRTAHNVYVVNLCIADSLLGLNAFVLAADTWDQDWAAENGFCGLFSFTTAFPPIAVVGSMLSIALNRHSAIVEAMGNIGTSTRQRHSALVHSAGVWSVAMILSLPVLVGWVTSRPGLFCACCVYFVENVIYSSVLTLFVYLLPNIVIMLVYARIFLHVRQSRMRVLEHHQQISADRSSVMNYPGTLRKSNSFRLTSDLRVVVQFLVLFLVFNICYFPATVVFWRASEDPNLERSVRGTVTILFAVNIIANPICYFCLNSRARAEISIACTCRHRLPRHSVTHPHRDDVSSGDDHSKSRTKSTTQRVTRSSQLTTIYKSPGAVRPPSGHSLRTVSELNLPASPHDVMSGRDGSVTSQQRSPIVTAASLSNADVVGRGDLGNGVAVGQSDANSTVGAGTWLQNEPELSDAPNALQVAAACRKLPLIRRAESLHVNIIGSDQYI